MNLINSIKLFIFSSLIMFLTSFSASALPIVQFKDINESSNKFQATTLSHVVNKTVKNIQNTQPNSYKIIVYKNNNHYLIYTLAGNTWKVEKIRIDLDSAGNVINFVKSYQGGLKDLKLATNNNLFNDDKPGICPDPNVQFLAISAYPGVAAVNDSIALVSEEANKKYKTMTINNENANGQTYRNWLSCPNLKGIYSIGHGAPDEIIVGNGDVVDYSFFNQEEMVNKYRNTTVVINSCKVYNYPFGTSMMYGNAMLATDFSKNPGPNAYEFVGGHTDLLMFASELSSACFMTKAIAGAKMDYDTLKQCISAKDIHFQDFGLSNPGRYFN